MSVTTTANPATYTLQATLTDYNLYHSESQNSPLDTSLNAHPASVAQNPSTWPHDHRRVPPYRPVNTELDQSQRRVYQNGIERAFVGVMFTGVFLEAVSIRDMISEEVNTNGCRRRRGYGGVRWEGCGM